MPIYFLSKCNVAALALGYCSTISPVTAGNLRGVETESAAGKPRMLTTEPSSCAKFFVEDADGTKQCVDKCPPGKLFHVEGTKKCLAACPPEASYFLDNTTTCVASITLQLSKNNAMMDSLFWMQIATQIGLVAVFGLVAWNFKRSNTAASPRAEHGHGRTLPPPASAFSMQNTKNASGIAHQVGASARVQGKGSILRTQSLGSFLREELAVVSDRHVVFKQQGSIQKGGIQRSYTQGGIQKGGCKPGVWSGGIQRSYTQGGIQKGGCKPGVWSTQTGKNKSFLQKLQRSFRNSLFRIESR